MSIEKLTDDERGRGAEKETEHRAPIDWDMYESPPAPRRREDPKTELRLVGRMSHHGSEGTEDLEDARGAISALTAQLRFSREVNEDLKSRCAERESRLADLEAAMAVSQ
jgi:hypothetical protein